jgi:flagellar biosynthesis protein FlhA
MEQTLADAVIQNEQESYLALEPRLAQKVVEAVAKGVEQSLALSGQPVFLCTAAVRPHLRRLIERYLPQVTVLSYNEIGPRVSVKVLKMVELSDAS